MEEWLSSVTKFSFASSDGDAMPPVTSELVPILNHILEQNGRFGDFLDQLENSRKENDQRADKMVETVLRLVERIDQSDDIGSALKRVAQGQEDLVKKLTSELNEDKGDNAESGVRLRGIENQLIKILNQMISRDIERK